METTGEATSGQSAGRSFWIHYGPMALGLVLGTVLFRMLPDELAMRMFFGSLAGVALGLIPYFIGRRRHRRVAIASIWICTGLGALGGVILALPGAIIMSLILRFAVRPSSVPAAGVPGAPPVGQHPPPGQRGQQPAPSHTGQYPPPGQWGQQPAPGYWGQQPPPGQGQ